MKLIIYINVIFSFTLFAQSSVVIGDGALIDLGAGTDLSAGTVSGTTTGDGTINGGGQSSEIFNYLGGSGGGYSSATSTTSPLPVELSSFTATTINNEVNLNWKTETEVDNYGFEIQRNSNLRGQQGFNENSDLEGYTKIGFVKGAGNSNSPEEYSFVDEEPPGGTIKYRLKQIDTDGEFEYSDEIEVEVAIPEKFALYQNYPNPFNPSTTIKFDLPEESPVKLIIYNILGEQVAELVNEVMPAGFHKMEFNANNFASGIYIYRIQAKDFTSVKKMLMVK